MTRVWPLFIALSLGSIIACGGSGGGVDGEGESDAGGGGILDAGNQNTTDAGINVCESLALSPAATPPRVMILQDLSSSLNSNSRWDNMRPAMRTVVDRFDQEFSMGLVPFSTTYLDGGTNDLDCTVTRSHVIKPRVSNATAIKDKVYEDDENDPNFIASADLVGGTPTYDSLVAAHEVLVGEDPGDDSARVVILVTDGEPNCLDGTGNSTSQADRDRVTNTITAHNNDNDITVYVVGYDLGNTASNTMDIWAAAGGTSTHFAADDTATLISQMSTIATALIPCEYTLDSVVADPDFVSVKIDGNGYAFEDADGWMLGPDNQTVILQGAACDTLRDGSVHDLEVTVECEPVIVQ